MSGHSHWATIKHKKGAADAKKGKLFSKIARMIIMAARSGGGDPDSNLKLQYALEEARAANMPRDNVERAIKRGTGELEGVTYEELTYEGYGPGGIALMIDLLTDNKNRTAAEIRKILEGANGKMGAANSVAYNFSRKGVMVFAKGKISEDQMMTDALDAGAEDMQTAGEFYEITTASQDFIKVKAALEKKGYKPESAEVRRVPKDWVTLDEEAGRKYLNLIDALEDHDDVQKVYSNADLPESLLK
jgi:YebC/PmpR family DNA-binding regulatory protein